MLSDPKPAFIVKRRRLDIAVSQAPDFWKRLACVINERIAINRLTFGRDTEYLAQAAL